MASPRVERRRRQVNAILLSLLVAGASALRRTATAQVHKPRLEGLLNVSTVVAGGAWLRGNQSTLHSRPANFTGNQSTLPSRPAIFTGQKSACEHLIAELVRSEKRYNKELHKMWDIMTKLSEQHDVVMEIIRKLGTSRVGFVDWNFSSGESAWGLIEEWVNNLESVKATSDTLIDAIAQEIAAYQRGEKQKNAAYLSIVNAVTRVADEIAENFASWGNYMDPCKDGQNAIELMYTLPQTSAWLREEEQRWEQETEAWYSELQENKREANLIKQIVQNPSQRVTRYEMLLKDLVKMENKCLELVAVIDAARVGIGKFEEMNENLNQYNSPISVNNKEAWENIKALLEDSKHFENIKFAFKKGAIQQSAKMFSWKTVNNLDDKLYLAKFPVALPKKNDLYLCSDAIFLHDAVKNTLYFIPLSVGTKVDQTEEWVGYPETKIIRMTIQADYKNAPKYTIVEEQDMDRSARLLMNREEESKNLAEVDEVVRNIEFVLNDLRRQPPQRQQ